MPLSAGIIGRVLLVILIVSSPKAPPLPGGGEPAFRHACPPTSSGCPGRWNAALRMRTIILPAQEFAMPAACDCFPELKVVTEAREARYRADPDKRAPEGPQSSLEIKVTSIGNLNERVET